MAGSRWTIRASMATIAALGALFARVRWEGSAGYALVVASHSVVAWGLGLAGGFAAARAFVPALRGRTARRTVWALAGLALAATLYLAWAHHRTMGFFSLDLAHGFLYPDRAIHALERWFGARRPVAPGSLKLHGEYPLVGLVLGTLVIAFAGVSGFLLAVASNRPSDLRR